MVAPLTPTPTRKAEALARLDEDFFGFFIFEFLKWSILPKEWMFCMVGFKRRKACH
jgi:hypothetical protein